MPMKAIGAVMLWLASATGSSAYFSVDVENHARWVVLDAMPLLASGQPVRPEVINLWTKDIAARPVPISAVCGTLDFHNMDDGIANFVVFYSMDDDGKLALVGRPFLYGGLSARNFDAQYEAALQVCGGSAEPPLVGATETAAGIAVVVETGVVAETEAAATATRP
jgi:hypothetical protein